jgi:hypothetical protein
MEISGCDIAPLHQWTNMANKWARSPLVVSEVSCCQDDEEVEVLSMPRMIPSVGFERPPWFPLRYK